MTGFLDNSRFGKQGWQKHWDGIQENSHFAMNLSDKQATMVINAAS